MTGEALVKGYIYIFFNITGAALVKGIGFEVSDKSVSGADIFSKLVPMEAHEASSLYRSALPSNTILTLVVHSLKFLCPCQKMDGAKLIVYIKFSHHCLIFVDPSDCFGIPQLTFAVNQYCLRFDARTVWFNAIPYTRQGIAVVAFSPK